MEAAAGRNIIGDVAGQYKTLIRLLAKMPKAPTILVGDLIDRGPNSKKVVSFARANQDWLLSLIGNHEHMMIDYVLKGPADRQYDPQIWLINGGGTTVRSYLPNVKSKEMTLVCIKDALFSDATWMTTLASTYKEPGLHVSHAPYNGIPETRLFDMLWYRGAPYKLPGCFTVHGHNAREKVKWFKDADSQVGMDGWVEKPWGVCIDTSKAKILTGIHWPTLEIFQQEYVD